MQPLIPVLSLAERTYWISALLAVLNAYATSNSTIRLVFDRALDPVTAQDVANYSRSISLGAIDAATIVGAGNQTVDLTTTIDPQVPATIEVVTAAAVKSSLGVTMTAPTIHQPSDRWWTDYATIRENLTPSECHKLLTELAGLSQTAPVVDFADKVAVIKAVQADLGTRCTISGGEVMELDGHLEARYEEQTDELPF